LAWYYRAGRVGEALGEFRALAAIDFTPALNRLGTMYLKGDGVPRDPGRAKDLWKRAANLGHVRARRNLGFLLISGRYGNASH